ncbi:branched-chain amino acid ABC transporter permease [Halorubellus sp. JP-L1]|uniref:branched-chain amino acid ABC transporter permease n=1 Tax=Halorubellus sp. JP-L1 TaxID=2715753 RepID=UPI00140CB3F8|nr:branched-chain amino acid ABC transporter permease [Halorubellus sp. JP-L1]NHN43029.1 branched-chain amino acid ABC transporter permease [Halorubellus sp. JP-L1]
MSVLEFVANGLVFSSIIVLASIGLSLVYSIANFANFAHGDTMTVGAYAALVTFGAVGTLGGSLLGVPYGFFVALLAGTLVAALVAVITHKIIYEPVEIGSIGLLITSIGVAFVYRSVIRMGFGADFTEYGIQVLRPIEAFLPYGVRLTEHDLAIVFSAVILVTALHVVLQYTDLGRKMRATADNPDLARVSGIRTNRIEIWTWIIGAGLAGAGGGFLGLFNQLSPRMGFDILLVVFAAVILGGIGSVYGAMLGGFLIGMINQMMPLLSNFGQYAPFVPTDWGIPIGIEYANAVAFVIMVAVLLARPNGIMGESAT